MDTIFRLLNFEEQQNYLLEQHHQSDQSFNSTSRTSSSSRELTHQQHPSSDYHYLYRHSQYQEECSNFFMDEDGLSSSSSKHQYSYPYQHQNPTSSTATPSSTPSVTPPYFHHSSSFSPSFDFSSSNWATEVLMEAGRAIAYNNTNQVSHMMWMLNELGSSYGDVEQKLASYFVHALFCRVTASGERTLRAMSSASDKSCSFESTRKLSLKFQEVSPWTTFGHVASNGTIMEAFEGESNLHIIDISNTYCTQWPTLLEALATRTDETPHLRLTTVVSSKSGKVMKEIGNRMEKFARLMGVPFKFRVLHHQGDLSHMNLAELDVKEGEALAINCVGSLHAVSPAGNKRDHVISNFRRLRPRVITMVEEEASFNVGDEGVEFLGGYEECVRWYRLYYEALDESFPRTSNERVVLERAAGRALVDLLACPAELSEERRERAVTWSRKMRSNGFSSVPFSDEVCDDVRALLRRYKGQWSMTSAQAGGPVGDGVFLRWKEEDVVWTSAWRPA